MDDVQKLIGSLYAVLSEDEDGHAWEGEAGKVASLLTKMLDETETVQRTLDDYTIEGDFEEVE